MFCYKLPLYGNVGKMHAGDASAYCGSKEVQFLQGAIKNSHVRWGDRIWFSHDGRPSIGSAWIKLGDTIFAFVVLCFLGVGMDRVRVLISERRAQSGELMSTFLGIV